MCSLEGSRRSQMKAPSAPSPSRPPGYRACWGFPEGPRPFCKGYACTDMHSPAPAHSSLPHSPAGSCVFLLGPSPGVPEPRALGCRGAESSGGWKLMRPPGLLVLGEEEPRGQSQGTAKPELVPMSWHGALQKQTLSAGGWGQISHRWTIWGSVLNSLGSTQEVGFRSLMTIWSHCWAVRNGQWGRVDASLSGLVNAKQSD